MKILKWNNVMSSSVSVRAILIVKNEDDILNSVIAHLLTFCETVYVLDNGSTDKSIDILRELNGRGVVYLGTIRVPFFDNLRNWVWQIIKDDAKDDDWWLFADADEFYAQDVVTFLNNVPTEYGVVLKTQIYPIPMRNQRDSFANQKNWDPDFYTHYFQSTWAEPRFLRHTKRLSIDSENLTFSRARAIFPVPIKLIHYNWRTVDQVGKRIATRRALRGVSKTDFSHMLEDVWEDVLESNYEKAALPFIDGPIWANRFDNFNPNSVAFRLKNVFRFFMTKLGVV
jgi:glycosyltransferase involved in cell wall biosynthesis